MKAFLTVLQGLGVLMWCLEDFNDFDTFSLIKNDYVHQICYKWNNPKSRCNKRLNCECKRTSCTSIMFEGLLKFEKMDAFFTHIQTDSAEDPHNQHSLCEILPELGA